MSRGSYHLEEKNIWLEYLLGGYVESDKKEYPWQNISLWDVSIWIKDADA